MADVMGAFFRGQQAAGRAQADQQALQENKLRMQVLKHQIDGLKIEDQIRQRRLAAEHHSLLEGLPEAQMPTEPVPQGNLPSTSYAGAMTGLPDVVSSLVQERQPGMAPETLPAPGAQATAPGTNMTTRRQGVTFGAIPEMGIPSATVQPRSMEELIRAQIVSKMNEPVTLGPGQRRFVGGRMVAEGGAQAPTQASLAVAAAGGDANAEKAVKLLRPGTSQQPANAQQKDVLLDGERAAVLFDPKAKTYTDLDGNKIEKAATRIKPIPPQDRSARDPGVAAKREYDAFYKLYTDTHPRLKSDDLTLLQTAGQDAQVQPRPAPSFEKWQVMTPQERQSVLSNPDSRIDDAEMLRRMGRSGGKGQPSAPKEAAKGDVPDRVKSFLQGRPRGMSYTLTNGSVWDVLPDGTIRRGQAAAK